MEQNRNTQVIERTIRADAEDQLACSPEHAPDSADQTPEQLIHELQVHLVELETQAEELRKSKVALEESRDKYLDLYEFSPTCYLILTDKAQITDTNLSGAALFNAPWSRLNGAWFRTFVAPEDHDQWDRYFMNLLKKGEKLTCHLLLLAREDGSVFPAQLESIRTTGSHGEVTVRIAIHDITDIRQVEEALEQSEERFRFTMRYLPGALWAIDTDLRFTLSQGNRFEVLGLEPEQVVGKTIYDVFKTRHPGDMVIAAHLRALHGEEVTYNYEYNGLIFKIFVVPMRKARGMVTGVVGIAFDITGTRQDEGALQKVIRKLNLLLSITRHDILNELTVLMGQLELLELKQSDPSFSSYMNNITGAAERIDTLIQFTKTYEDSGVNVPAWQDCRKLVDTVATQASLGQVTVNNDLLAGVEVLADPLIVKVFYNLVDNAVRYGGKITAIRFSVQETGNDHLIVCGDDGNGVPAEDKEKIFERGFGKNTGMGLFLSREILDITGITITEMGEPGKGARFEMRVPKETLRMTGDGA